MLPLLLACSGAAVTLTTAPMAEHPLPAGLDALVASHLQRPISTCYDQAREKDPGLKGTAVVTGYGSHGVLTVHAAEGTAPAALVECVTSTLATQKAQRALVDGDTIVGFELRATFG